MIEEELNENGEKEENEEESQDDTYSIPEKSIGNQDEKMENQDFPPKNTLSSQSSPENSQNKNIVKDSEA